MSRGTEPQEAPNHKRHRTTRGTEPQEAPNHRGTEPGSVALTLSKARFFLTRPKMPISGLVADTRSPKIAPYKCPWPRVRCQKRSILASLKIAPSIIFSRVIQPN